MYICTTLSGNAESAAPGPGGIPPHLGAVCRRPRGAGRHTVGVDSLALAVEDNARAFLEAAFARVPGVQPRVGASVCAVLSNVAHPLANIVMFPRGVDEITVSELVAEGVARQVPRMWWLGASTEDLVRTELAASGAREVTRTPALAAPISSLSADAVPGLEIDRVAAAADLDALLEVMGAAFGATDAGLEFMVSALGAAGLGLTGSIHSFLGRLHGDVVGCATVLVGAGVAGIYNVGTVPDARGLGIGRALTAHAARAGRAYGADDAVLQTTRAAESLYAAMGFGEVCVIDRWISSP